MVGGFFPLLRIVGFFIFPRSLRALNKPKQAALSHQNKLKQNKPFFSHDYHEEALQPALWRVYFFLIIKKKKGKKEKRRGEGGEKKKRTSHPGEVSIRHQHSSGVIPYLMAVSEGERQRGG